MRKLLIATLAAAVPATMALAQSAENTLKARQGFFQLISFEMGGLAAMAKGDVEYDAEAASAHAADLSTLMSLHIADYFAPETSNADLPGKTRAQPVIWEDMDGFMEKATALNAAVETMAGAAGNGLDALRPAVGQLGGTCKACHDDYRAKSF
ncbi:cytochrome c [Citreicella sp. C3M06]|uniref:c-type cytochrome n=1 Tax=Citreicella sp. C3M06 TaxID=2841564 RepID=UPI001C09678F|nr:cytochrome c [Citreicella sp. C3M06]MBU2962410.1 cytochrome c [Citreicella sp. C3M06]